MSMTKQKTNALIKVLDSSSDSDTPYKESGRFSWMAVWHFDANDAGMDGKPAFSLVYMLIIGKMGNED